MKQSPVNSPNTALVSQTERTLFVVFYCVVGTRQPAVVLRPWCLRTYAEDNIYDTPVQFIWC